jgi:CheY-like chemotaxis protein
MAVQEQQRAAKASVLVVDDELALGRACARILERGGHRVVTTTDGIRAWELFGGGGFDVVVCDVVMPGMSGLELLRAAHERDGDVPVVLVTGNPTDQDAEDAAAGGALMYLTKPIDPRVLLQVVEHAWRLRRRSFHPEPAAQGCG